MDDGKGGDFVSLSGYHTNYLKLWYTVERNITKGTIYRFRYRAKNNVGWGPFSDISFIQAANVPAKPPVPVYVSSTTDSITLEFSQSDDDGGTPITEYKLFKDVGDSFSSAFSEVGRYDGSSLTFTMTVNDDGLVSQRIYRFVYVATNALGDSAYSNELIAGIGALPTKPNTPQKNVLLSNETSTYIYWDKVTTSQLPLSGYILYMDEGLGGPF